MMGRNRFSFLKYFRDKNFVCGFVGSILWRGVIVGIMRACLVIVNGGEDPVCYDDF